VGQAAIRRKGNVAGIDEVLKHEPAGNQLFDLSGRQVTIVGKKGVYICNGKKLFVK